MSKDEIVSPLLSRMQDQPKLSLKNLAHHIPRIRAGREAEERLNAEENLSFTEKRSLQKSKVEGESSKEELVLMALPLVHTIARKEYNRRSAWSSRVTLDDMVQEGMGGFLRGIESYNVEGNQNSPTNYLGQWIVSDIRRHVESMDHDFTIPHETVERYRKIRAIRSLLYNKLGRFPTDQEMIDHANDAANQPVNKMGRVNKARKGPSPSRMLTLKHIEEEREANASTGVLESLTGTDDDNSEYERNANPLDGSEAPSSTQAIDERSAREALSAFFSEVFKEMRLGTIQEDIIRRKHGFPPYSDEIPLTEIAQGTGVSKYKANQVISAFTADMASPGSMFHRAALKLSEDELNSFDLGWVIKVMGTHAGKSSPVDSVLTRDMKVAPRAPRKKFGEPNRGIQYNHIAYYECENGHTSEKAIFASANRERALEHCLDCGGPVILVKTKPLQTKKKAKV